MRVKSKEKKPSERKQKKTILNVRSQLRKLAPDEKCFFLCTGQVIKHYKELADELGNVDEGVFHYHVNSGKNDFANWVRDVFAEPELADALQHAHSKDHVRVVIYKFIADKLW
ncbi:MAG: hypothetical protein V1725_01610 [archaeon]